MSKNNQTIKTAVNCRFGQRLEEERKRLEFTQISAAKACGITKQTWITWAQNSPIPSAKLEICSTLGMDVQYIVTGVRSQNLHEIAILAAETTLALTEATGTYIPPKRNTIEIEHDVLVGVMAAVDEYLEERDLEMTFEDKGDLVFDLCSLYSPKAIKSGELTEDRISQVIKLKSAGGSK